MSRPSRRNDMRAKLVAVPMTIKRANRYVKRWHRHLKPAVGALFAVAVAKTGTIEPVGVAIVGRCPARLFDQRGNMCEVTRIATDGTPNACSFLWGLARRIVQIMGYRSLTTLTLPEEGGASLRGAGLKDPVAAGGGSWDRPSRRREKPERGEGKLRWTEEVQKGAIHEQAT